MRVKLMVAFIIAAGAAAIFFLSGTGSDGKAVFYYSPSEYFAQPDLAKERLRLKGKIEPGSVRLSADRQDLSFSVTDGQKRLPVHFQGPVPDAFQEGLEVVVDGRMGPAGVFEGRDLIVKCPSKYESGAKGPAAPQHPQEIPAR